MDQFVNTPYRSGDIVWYNNSKYSSCNIRKKHLCLYTDISNAPAAYWLPSIYYTRIGIYKRIAAKRAVGVTKVASTLDVAHATHEEAFVRLHLLEHSKGFMSAKVLDVLKSMTKFVTDVD